MHYYQFNIGDYAKATRHLSNLEDLAYRRLMDIYYDTEKPLTSDVDKLARLINMRENKQEIENVLTDFFVLSDEGYSQKRIDEEIEHYTAKADAARANGKKGGRPKKAKANPKETKQEPKKTQSVILANPEETGSKANQEPITNNQQPTTSNQVNKETLPAKASNSFSSEVKEIFEYWKQVMSKGDATKLTKEREKNVKARLKDGYTVEQIKQAIDGCSKNPFNMGENSNRKPYNDLELICRNSTKLEDFALGSAPNQDLPYSATTARNIQSIKDWG